MSTYVQAIFDCHDPDEVIGVLNTFLQDLVESGFAEQIPFELRPLHIRTAAELDACLMPVRIQAQRLEAAGITNDPVLIFLAGVLEAARRQLDIFDTRIRSERFRTSSTPP